MAKDLRKLIEIELNLGSDEEPKLHMFHVKEPTRAQQRELAAYEGVWNRDGDGKALDALVNAGLVVTDLPDEELDAFSPSEQLVVGRRLAEWGIRGNSGN